MSIVTCPRCDAKWAGLKIEHCRGGFRSPSCHLTFSSTRAADRHLVDMDERGFSRHLTADELLALRRQDGNPRFVVKRNKFGTDVWSEWHDPKPHPMALAQKSDGLTAAGAGGATP